MRLICLVSLLAVAMFFDGPSKATLEQAYDELSAASRERWQPAIGEVGWHAENSGRGGGRPDADIDLRIAEVLAAGCHAPVQVAVIDGGFVRERPELARHWYAGWDFVERDADPFSADAKSRFRHGSAVAALIAEVAPRARLMPLRIYNDAGGGRADEFFATAIRHAADAGAEVINLSAGIIAFRSSEQRIRSVEQAVRYAIARGALVVAASGNDGYDNSQGGAFSFHPAAEAARIEGAISVAASDAADQLWAGSNTGAELAAPGVEVLSVGFDERSVAYWTGTSLAAPLVSGTAALVRSCRPDLSPAALEDLLRRTAEPLSGPGSDGAEGRLNAGEAVAAALKYASAAPYPG